MPLSFHSTGHFNSSIWLYSTWPLHAADLSRGWRQQVECRNSPDLTCDRSHSLSDPTLVDLTGSKFIDIQQQVGHLSAPKFSPPETFRVIDFTHWPYTNLLTELGIIVEFCNRLYIRQLPKYCLSWT